MMYNMSLRKLLRSSSKPYGLHFEPSHIQGDHFVIICVATQTTLAMEEETAYFGRLCGSHLPKIERTYIYNVK